jgi:hypothetical protein
MYGTYSWNTVDAIPIKSIYGIEKTAKSHFEHAVKVVIESYKRRKIVFRSYCDDDPLKLEKLVNSPVYQYGSTLPSSGGLQYLYIIPTKLE